MAWMMCVFEEDFLKTLFEGDVLWSGLTAVFLFITAIGFFFKQTLTVICDHSVQTHQELNSAFLNTPENGIFLHFYGENIFFIKKNGKIHWNH